MRAILIAARAAAAALLFIPAVLSAAEIKVPSTDATPAELVNAALRSELDGPSDLRKTLLDRALALDPSYAPARWHSGYVRWDDDWLTLSEIVQRTSIDKRLNGYRQRRDTLVDTADSHRELARWCQKNRLVDEARIHWAKVLEFDPQDADAIAGLGLQVHNGVLLTRQQIADARRAAKDRADALRLWKPRLEKWRKALDSDGPERDEAIASMAQLRDPQVLAALQMVFATPGKSDGDKKTDQLLVKTLGQIHSPDATRALVGHALGGTQHDLACAQLKKRPLAAFVPQLIASLPLPSSWSASYNVMLLPQGGVWLNTEWQQQQGNQQHSVTHGTYFQTVTSVRSVRNPQLNSDSFDFGASLTRAVAAARQFEHQAQQADQLQRQRAQQTAWQAERIHAVLADITGAEEPKNREAWQSWWADYSETYTPSYDPSLRYGNLHENYFQASVQVQRIQLSLSCFPAGTKVLTIAGKRPIETLQLGDRVVCENAETGELVAKPVQGVTLRPAAPLVKLTLGSHTISATRGHPFWVNGQGWTMAKHLRVGQFLHGLDGAVRIDAIEEAPQREAYNLVVGDYGTYFVGQQPVLVHDNSPLTETTALVPGWI
ncbi:MAG: polymorphic toxin-type HINT domain-containing protein [Pirellulales bacterium]